VYRVELPDPAVPDEFAGVPRIGTRAFVAARLQDAPVTLDRVTHGAPLGDRVHERLLAVHVLARLRGRNADQAVPVVGRPDAHRVDILAGNQLAKSL